MRELQQDFLMAQILQLVQRLAERAAGDSRVEVDVEVEVGLSLDTASHLPLEGLLRLLTTTHGLEAERALLLGAALVSRARALPAGEAAALTDRGVALIEAAVAAQPALATGPLGPLLEAVIGPEP